MFEPLPLNNKPFSWGPSRLKAYYTCPLRFYAQYASPDPIPYVETEASLWGKRVHFAFEMAVQNKTSLPKEFAMYTDYLNAVTALPGKKHTETKYAYSDTWEAVLWELGWLRCIVDLVVINEERAIVIDYKTGSSRYLDNDQLAASALCVFMENEKVQTVKAGYLLLKEDKATDPIVYNRSDMGDMKRAFERKLAPIRHSYDTGVFLPKQGGLCKRYCPVESCIYNGE